MKNLIILILCFYCCGCASTHFVDAKGRDCKHKLFLYFMWDTCEEEQEPLAVTRQEIKVDAEIEQK